jgi:putative salt-induced outer membrane protein YdiY
MKFRDILIFCTLFVCSFAGNAFADQVYLKNGDRITGQVITMKEGKLIFEASYAGEISIDWEEVSELKTDVPITVILSDETSLQGFSAAGEDGKMRLKTEKIPEPVSFNIAEVTTVNPAPVKAVRLNARVNVGLKVEGGNTDKEEFHMDGNLVARTEKNRFTAGIEFDRDESDGERTENAWLAYVKYDHFLTKKWYLNVNSSFEKDDFKDISSRTVLGVGPGYQYWQSDLRNLSAELGFAYVAESYGDNTDDSDYSSIRWALNFDHYLYKKIVQFFHWDEAFYSLDDSEDIWLRTRTGLRFPIYKGLTWTVQYNYDWERSPLPGKDKADTTLLFTLGYQFTE